MSGQINQHEQPYLIDQDYSNQKHSNEFLSEIFEDNEKRNNFNTGIAPEQTSAHHSFDEGDLEQQQQQERHINELIDNYNSQYEFYKPNKSGSQVHQNNKNNQNSLKEDQSSIARIAQNQASHLKQSNHHQNVQKQQDQQYSNNVVNYQDQPIPITTVLAEERAKNQYISTSSAANIQSFQNDDYEYCPNCNRKFFQGRLNLHLKSCKPNKPLKPVKKQSQSQAEMQEQEEYENQNQQSPQKQNLSSVQQARNADNSKISASTQEKEKYLKQQVSKISNQITTVANSEREEPYTQHVSRYNIEPFEHKINDQQNEQPTNENRVACGICGRQFMPDRVEKHELACQKQQKARPVYNSSAARCPQDENGQSLIPKANLKPPKQAKKISEMTIVPKNIEVGGNKKEGVTPKRKEENIPNENSIALSNAQTNSSSVKAVKASTKNSSTVNGKNANNNQDEKVKKVPKWKLEHQQFIENIRYNKMIKQVEKEGGDVSKIEKPVDDLEALGYVCCQYCQRKFAKDTAVRHIPLCKNIINRPKPPRQPSRQNSEKVTGSGQQNGENKKSGARKLTTKNNSSSKINRIEIIVCKQHYIQQQPTQIKFKAQKKQKLFSSCERIEQQYQFKKIVDDSQSQLKSSISNIDSQQQTNDNSDQVSQFSHKTLNTTGGYTQPSQKLNSKVSSAIYEKQKIENNQKSRTGLLPDINGKQPIDKKYFTSRKFGSYNSKSNNGNNNTNNSSSSAIQNEKMYENIYTRVQQISTVSCPHCDRVFAKNAADRHIPICKNIVNRPNPLNDIARNTRQDSQRQSLPKKGSAQQTVYMQRQSLGHNQQSPRPTDSSRIIIEGQNYIKPRTSDSSSFSKIPNSLGSTKATNFCGFCGFQFAMDHKYCGSCGKQRFSTAKKATSQNSKIGSKTNFDHTLVNNITSIIE